MKVVILSTSEKKGGAAVAARRLMNALNKSGAEACMLVRDKQTDDRRVFSVNVSWFARKLNFIRFVWERIIIYLNNKQNRSGIFQVSTAGTGVDVSHHPAVKSADVIHLHWVNQGFLSLKDIEKLTALGKPAVWTMHDMWPFTGICHYARECVNYKEQCGNCFFLESDNAHDLSSKVFNIKSKILAKNPVTFVGCSQWLASCALNSPLTVNSDVRSIPNPIDTCLYKPQDKTAARERFALPAGKRLILFGAFNIADPRKGFHLFLEALHFLKSENPALSDELEVVVFGQAKAGMLEKFPVPVRHLGYLSGEEDIATLYNAADLFVIPSLEENLPNTIMESMACGTPCVGFDVGGIPEMIDHKQNGYVAVEKSAPALAGGIEWVLDQKDSLNLRAECLKKVQSCYAEQIVAAKYISLYKKLLNR